MATPQLIEVDPRRITFNVSNPRRHRGTDFLRLKKSIQEFGMIQMPTVRVIPAGMYECVDGEGRVRIAQEEKLPKLWVVSLGTLSDREAMHLLQAANAIRSFGLLAECRGLANLHRKGDTTAMLADKFGISRTMAKEMVAVGYFPDEIVTMIQDDSAKSEEHAHRWTISFLRELLALRQELPGKDALHALNLDEVYDYSEVKLTVEKIVRGEIPDAAALMAYAAQRRLEVFQQRFDQTLQTRLQSELEQTKQTLEQSKQALERHYQQQFEHLEEQAASKYQGQVEHLEQQYADLEKRYQEMVREVARRPDIVAQREEELAQQIEEIEAERISLQELEQQLHDEARDMEQRFEQRLQDETQEKIEEALQEHREEFEQERAEVAEATIRHTIQLLSQAEHWFQFLVEPENATGWLQQPESLEVRSRILKLRDVLNEAEAMIERREKVTHQVEEKDENKERDENLAHQVEQ